MSTTELDRMLDERFKHQIFRIESLESLVERLTHGTEKMIESQATLVERVNYLCHERDERFQTLERATEHVTKKLPILEQVCDEFTKIKYAIVLSAGAWILQIVVSSIYVGIAYQRQEQLVKDVATLNDTIVPKVNKLWYTVVERPSQ